MTEDATTRAFKELEKERDRVQEEANRKQQEREDRLMREATKRKPFSE
jgi:hypothetical protein